MVPGGLVAAYLKRIKDQPIQQRTRVKAAKVESACEAVNIYVLGFWSHMRQGQRKGQRIFQILVVAADMYADVGRSIRGTFGV